MPYAEIDQSGKIEQFNMDTVVALSNKKKFSVLLTKKDKQDIFIEFKGKIKDLKYKIFSILLFYCLADFIDENTKIIICKEYEGQERIIKNGLFSLLDNNRKDYRDKEIVIDTIGKGSPAHRLALSVLRKDIRPNRVLSYKDIKKKIRT